MSSSPSHRSLDPSNARGSFTELAAFIEKQRDYDHKLRYELEVKMEEVRNEAKLEREALLAKLQAAELRAAALEATRSVTQTEEDKEAKEAVSDEQVAALEARLEAAHASKLLSDDEAMALEDLVADFLEARASLAVDVVTMEVVQVHTLISLSAGLKNDKSFARQATRKFVS